MVIQGTKRCLKVSSRHLESPFWAHQISAASSQPSTHKMKAAGIKSQVRGPAAEAKPVDIYIYIYHQMFFFLKFSLGFPWVLLKLSHGVSMVSLTFSVTFLRFSLGLL